MLGLSINFKIRISWVFKKKIVNDEWYWMGG